LVIALDPVNRYLARSEYGNTGLMIMQRTSVAMPQQVSPFSAL
jgi:hypothetical protein